MNKSVPNSLAQSYEETIVEIILDDHEMQGLGWAEYFLITAWNPFSQKLTVTENLKRNELLLEDLRTLGAESMRAIGRSPDWEWFEESFAAKKISLELVVDLAKKYEQNAIFQINQGVRKVISCLG